MDNGTLAMLAGQALPPGQAARPPRLEGATTGSPSDDQATVLSGDRGANRPDTAHQQPSGDVRDPKTAASAGDSNAPAQAASDSHAAYQAEAGKAHILTQAGASDLSAQPGFPTGSEASLATPATAAAGGTAAAGTAASTPPPPAARHEVATLFGQRGWDQAVSTRVLWVAQDQLQQASLTLNPPHLGPIQVMVQMDNNQQAVVQFVAAQPEVRQALQEALPVLRDMFGQAGIELGQTNVSSGHSDQGSRQQARQDGRNQNDNPSILPLIETASMSVGSAGLGLINTFA